MTCPYPELVARYRNARQHWRQPGVEAAAQAVGMDDERAYCDQFVVAMGPIVTQADSMAEITALTTEAYDEAGAYL